MNSSPTPQELTIPLRHLTLAAQAWGDPSLPPLLAIHGWLDNAASFSALAPLLEDRYVVAIDLPGHGRSAWRADGNWDHWVDYLGDLDQVIAHFGWDRIDLLGHSLGGTLASTYAAVFPERVQRLLLIEALGPLPGAVASTLSQLRRGLAGRRRQGDRGMRVFASVQEAAEARMQANGLSEAAALALVRRGLVEVGSSDEARGYSWSSDPRLALPSLQRFSEEQVSVILAGIQAPTLLIVADPPHAYVPEATMQSRIAQLARIEVLQQTGNHHLHLENPQPIAAAINDFLQRHQPAPAAI